MDYLTPVVNAVVVAAATLLVVWVGMAVGARPQPNAG